MSARIDSLARWCKRKARPFPSSRRSTVSREVTVRPTQLAGGFLRASLVTAYLALPVAGCAMLSDLYDVGKTLSDMTVYTKKGDPLVVHDYISPRPQPKQRFSVGVGSSDITPPPGFPTGGDGPAADVARGNWLRLRSRAFFFEDDSGHTLALVTADVFGLSAALRERVVELAQRRHPDVSLPVESLVLAANHTHQGPGNFLSTRVHNQFGSAYPGFDRELFEFLAHRIAHSISEAIVDARSRHGDVELKLRVARIGYDLLMNRSPSSFMLNRERDEMLAALNQGMPEPDCTPEPGEAPGGWELPGCPRLRALDRTLTILEIGRRQGDETESIGAIVFFAAHPTALDARTPFYSSDFSGYAMSVLEARLGSRGERPFVVGHFNGAEGDVTLRRKQRDVLAARDFGLRFANRISSALEQAPTWTALNPKIAIRSGEWYPANREQAKCGNAQLASPPMAGAAMLGGAENDYTDLRAFGWREGVRDRPINGQGPKLPAMDSRIIRGLRLSEMFMPEEAFPTSIPMTYASLGPLQLAAVPMEMTTAQGYVVRKALGSLPHGTLEIVGLANEYASYCSAFDEYAAQDYMGASTLWGPRQGEYLACRLVELSKGEHPAPSYHHAEREFWPGMPPKPAFGPSFIGAMERPDEGLDTVLLNEQHVPERKLPWFAWQASDRGRPYEDAFYRRISIVQFDVGRQCWQPIRAESETTFAASLPQAESDQGTNFLTLYLGRSRWAAIWLRPLFDPNLAGTFAFQVVANGATHTSIPFEIQKGRPWPDEVPEENRVASSPMPQHCR